MRSRRRGRKDAESIEKAEWIKTKPIKEEHLHLKRAFLKDVDEGESEAIVLAIRESADLILLDEYDARELARNHSLKVTGAIGILLKAKEIGKIQNPVDHLDNLRESGFWINNNLYEKVCTRFDEMNSN